ncbi:carboxymuconolactone decarboxylase [Parafrankia colletiae]|uniref:Carboxymuconolactone decarboxylase n=1 Tax=Parafrankia colletiae TaxID=573497 RepID=A0A1S1R8V3_9ACTN|nr:carboxymuconolactone decarboxylase family protein [Parafrankia colletiae]MCK9903219.1 carboxymuconolactone decarboxylase family protein [Frankia sp. Cpl3]OHV41144.1 carboxymuconolactone decarboxylase [Parafrankia colletiae]
MARIEPRPLRQWPKEMREALAAMTPEVPRHPPLPTEGRSKALNTLGTLAHHPELAHAFFTYNGHILRGTTLTLRQRETLVLRVSAVRKNAYEWAQHVIMARDLGITDAEIARIAWGPDAPFLDPLDAALIRAVDELIIDGEIALTTWEVLSAKLDVQQLLDVIFTVGTYETLSMMMRSFELPLDDDLHES